MNASRLLPLLALLGMVSGLIAKDRPAENSGPKPFTLTTITGKTYRKAVVQTVEPDALRITHDEGAARIPFEQLSEAQRKQYGMSEDRAMKHREEVAAQKEKDEEQARQKAALDAEAQEESAFRVFRYKLLNAIKSGDYDYAKLDQAVLDLIRNYQAAGKKEWAETLEEDRKMLAESEKQRPARELASRTKALEQENARLQSQIDSLNRSLSNLDRSTYDSYSRRITIYDPYYYRYYSRPIVVLPPSTPCPPPSTPCPPRINPQPIYQSGGTNGVVRGNPGPILGNPGPILGNPGVVR